MKKKKKKNKNIRECVSKTMQYVLRWQRINMGLERMLCHNLEGYHNYYYNIIFTCMP